MNIITRLNQLRRIADSYGADFKFNAYDAAMYLPKKSAPFIVDHLEQELWDAGILPYSYEDEQLGNVMVRRSTSEECPDGITLVFFIAPKA